MVAGVGVAVGLIKALVSAVSRNLRRNYGRIRRYRYRYRCCRRSCCRSHCRVRQAAGILAFSLSAAAVARAPAVRETDALRVGEGEIILVHAGRAVG